MKEIFLKLRMVYATVIIRPKAYHACTTINISSAKREILEIKVTEIQRRR